MTNTKMKRTVIITGGNSGLGFECAKEIALAQQGWQIVLACRSSERGKQAVDDLITETGHNNIDVLQLDLASLRSVRNFVTNFQIKNYPSINGLVCNAGLISSEGIQYTEDGFELTFGVNHLGHFLLTNLLLSHFNEPGRIIVVSSNTHNTGNREGQFAPATYLGAKELAYPEPGQDLSAMQRYTTSKLCNILFTYELDRKLRNEDRRITVNAFDPGFTPGTNLVGDGQIRGRMTFRRTIRRTLLRSGAGSLMGIVSSTPGKSGKAMARLLLDQQLEGVSGKYYQILEEIDSSDDSYNLELASDLWKTSVELTNLMDSNT